MLDIPVKRKSTELYMLATNNMKNIGLNYYLNYSKKNYKMNIIKR